MGSDEIRVKCGQCGAELKESDKECLECGSTKKVFIETLEQRIHLKVTGSYEHVAPWDSKSYAILCVIVTIILFFLYLAYQLLPLSSGLRIVVLIIVLLVLGSITYRQRYLVLMFIRWLDTRFTARKRGHIK